MPDYGDYQSGNDAGMGYDFVTASEQEIQSAARSTGNRDQNWVMTLAGDAALGVMDLADTVASSIPGLSRVTGLERGQLNNKMLAALDMPGLTDFYNRNKQGIQVASGITGVIAAELTTRKFLKAATPFIGTLRTAPYAGRLLSLDRQYAEAMGVVRQVDTQLARSGVTGAQAWTQVVPTRLGTVTEAGPSLGTLFDTTRRAAANKVMGLSFVKGAARAGASEVTMATMLNQNEFLYSDDAGQNMMWMGLGVGLGGAFSTFGTGYAMRKYVNGDTLRRLKAEALDPSGQEAALTAVAKLGDKPTWLGHMQGPVTDRVTSMMVSAKASLPQGVDPTTFNRMASQHEKKAFEEVVKFTGKGLPGIENTRFDGKALGYTNHIQGALHKDPGMLYGAEMGGAILDDVTIAGTHQQVVTEASERMDELVKILGEHDSGAKILKEGPKAALMKEMKQLRFQRSLTPMALIDQELMPLSHAQAYDNWVEPKIKATRFDKETDILRPIDANTGKPFDLEMESNGNLLRLPKVNGVEGTIDSIDHFDALRLYRMADQVITKAAKDVANPKMGWTVQSRIENGKQVYNWFDLDMAEELAKRTDGRAKIDWGTLTRESAQRESMIQKMKALRERVADDLSPGELQKLRVRYNLPRLTSYQIGLLGTDRTPIDQLIRGSSALSDAQLDKLTLQDLKQGFADMSNIGDLAKKSVDDVDSLSGNSFRFMQDDMGAPVKPVLIYKRPIAVNDWAPDRLAERIGAKKTAQATLLVSNESGPITRELAAGIYGSPDTQLASQTTGLIDTQLASSAPGLNNIAPQTGMGSIQNSVVTAEWRARDNPVILAAIRLRETVDRQMRGFMRETIETAFGDRLAVFNGPRSLESRTLMDNFHSMRSGWDLTPGTAKVQGKSGVMHGFVLADTANNKQRFAQQYGREMPKGQTLLDSRGKEVVLDDLALDIQQRFNSITDVMRIEKNSLLRAQGLAEIRKTEWYTPPPDLKGKYIGFAQDAEHNVIPGSTIVAATQDSFNRQLATMQADPASILNTVPGAKFRTRDEIKDFATIWDRAQMEMLNPGTTAVQGGKESRGFLTGPASNVNRFQESLTNMRDNFLAHGDDLLQVVMDDQIKAAKARSHIASGITRNADSKQIKYRSVYDYWLEAIQARSPIQSEGSAVGWIYNGLEEKFNTIMREATPTANRVWEAVGDWTTRRVPWMSDGTSKQQFTQLSEKLGQHMPFESTAEMIERKGIGARPLELAQLTGGANRFTATWMLRMMEPIAAVMNMAGIVNSMPAVIRNVSARRGESAADLAARVGHSATIFHGGEGQSFAAIDMTKIAYRGFKRAWSKSSDAEFEYMAKNGFLSQEVAEFQRQFNVVEDKGTWSKFFTGDPQATSSFAKKGLVGWMSILTDKSEDFSRSWGHMAGLEVAEMMGITDKIAKHNFAHDLANKMIANYSPHNRPEIFQGAVGAPIGLFQSFMWNYYQRMFRYVETGDAASIATQYAMQSTLFGAKSVPGWNELNQMFFEASDGKSSPYDAMVSKFGQSGGDMLMSGVLSNLPKLFGAPAMDLVSRGDVSPRIVETFLSNPTDVVTKSASVSAYSKVLGGIADGVKLFGDANPSLSVQQVGEVLSNMIPNRPIAGFIETTMSGGYDTDPLGQVVSQTKNWMDATYRMMGVRTLQQSKDLEAFYSNKQAMEISAAQREDFNSLIRGSIRGGDMDAIPGYIQQYLENGGDARNVRRMLKSAYEAATETRSERQLENVLGNPSKMHMVNRLLDAEVGIAEEEATPDPSTELGVTDSMNDSIPTNSPDSDLLAYGM